MIAAPDRVSRRDRDNAGGQQDQRKRLGQAAKNGLARTDPTICSIHVLAKSLQPLDRLRRAETILIAAQQSALRLSGQRPERQRSRRRHRQGHIGRWSR